MRLRSLLARWVGWPVQFFGSRRMPQISRWNSSTIWPSSPDSTRLMIHLFVQLGIFFNLELRTMLGTNRLSNGTTKHPKPIDRGENCVFGKGVDDKKELNSASAFRRPNHAFSHGFANYKDLQIRHQRHIVPSGKRPAGTKPAVRSLRK